MFSLRKCSHFIACRIPIREDSVAMVSKTLATASLRGESLTMYTHHHVSGLLKAKGIIWLADSHNMKVENPKLTVWRYNVTSPFIQPISFPRGYKITSLWWPEVFSIAYVNSLDLMEIPLLNVYYVWFYSQKPASSVWCLQSRLCSSLIGWGHWSQVSAGETFAQLAEWIDCSDQGIFFFSKNKRVTVRTDSKYAFLVCHAHVAIWVERGLLRTL